VLDIADDILIQTKSFLQSLRQEAEQPRTPDNRSAQPINSEQAAQIVRTQSGDFSMPYRGRITSRFGMRRDPFSGRQRMHRGVDISGNTGDTVRSIFDGTVQRTGYQRNGAGNYVVVRHNDGVETHYFHLAHKLAQPNQHVSAGQALGLLGNSGRSTSPHLHFEIRHRGAAINPEQIIDFANARLRNLPQNQPVQNEQITEKEK